MDGPHGSENRLQKLLPVAISLLAFLISVVAPVIWNASGNNAQTQEKIRQLDEHLKYDDDHLARSDVIDPQLREIQKSQDREEKILEQQGKMLDEIRLELMRRH